VRDSAAALAPAVGRCVFISTVSAYRDWPYADSITEESPLFDGDPDLDPGTRTWDPDAYGPLEVGYELALRRAFGQQLVILRPHVVLGPHEYVGRLPWWLRRSARGGPVLAPAPDRSIQPVDARDLAAFAVALLPVEAGGVFNIAAPAGRETFGGMLAACRAATGSDAEPVWVAERWLVEHGVRQWTELPLWRALPTAWTMDVSRAHQAGLSCRPLAETVCDTWEWMLSGGRPVAHQRWPEHGIDPDRESALLQEWETVRQRGSGR